jgi:hypothetical protein
MSNPGADWGYAGLGREPGRVASLIFVACAVGAIAGAGAVFSLVAQPGSETSIGAAHPLGSVVARAAAHSPVKESTVAPSQARSVWTPSVSQEQLPSRVAVIDEGTVTPTTDGSGSAIVEPTAVPPERSAPTQHDPAASAPAPAGPSQSHAETLPAEKKANRKPAYLSRYAWRGGSRDGGRWGGFFEDRGWRSRQYW